MNLVNKTVSHFLITASSAFIFLTYLFSQQIIFDFLLLGFWLVLAALMNSIISVMQTVSERKFQNFVLTLMNFICLLLLTYGLIFLFLVKYKLIDWGR
jgi:hypothetical protein